MLVHSPAPPISVRAASRWYLACQAAATAQVMPVAHKPMKVAETGKAVRLPMCSPRVHSGMVAAASAAHTSQSICHCKRCVPSQRRPTRAARLMLASRLSKMRWPSRCCKPGASLRCPRARCQRSARYTAAPPSRAARLMRKGVLRPCQTARLKEGNSPPTTGKAAALRYLPTDHAGSMPTTRQASTSSSTGTRIQCGGSCGVSGRSVAAGPQNTSMVKRSE